MTNCHNKRNKQQQYDDDEFAEFDDLYEDDNQKSKDNLKQKSQQQQQQPPQKVPNANDFDELEITVENEDEEDYEAQPPPPKKTPSSTTTPSPQKPVNEQKQPKLDTLDMEEFENLVDDEEFEGFDESKQNIDDFDDVKEKPSKKKIEAMPNLKIATVPEHLMLTNNWKSYYLELIMCLGIVIYTVNMLIGKSKNSALASAWFNANRDLLEKQFALVGDNGANTEIPSNDSDRLIKESDNIYGLWCSGRQSCLNMFIQLKLLKRQDLISVISNLFKPQNDQIIISVEFDRKDLDSYVFCLANRKLAQSLMRDYQDLNQYCSEKKQLGEKLDLSSKYTIINEIGDVPSMIIDPRVCTFLKKHPDLVEYIIISDQYVGYKIQQDDQQNVQNKPQTASNGEVPKPVLGLQNSRAMMIICINIPKSNKNGISIEDIENMQPALDLAVYLIDKIPRVILPKDAKDKSTKRRKEVTEFNMKAVNKQRQEALQQKKEEKRRAEKEKIMNESDPEKQKKLEEKEAKREKKRNQGKLKQVKIKSM